MKSIHILVSPTGEVFLATKGFTDDACREASRALEKALGIITQDRPSTTFESLTSQSQEIRS